MKTKAEATSCQVTAVVYVGVAVIGGTLGTSLGILTIMNNPDCATTVGVLTGTICSKYISRFQDILRRYRNV